LEHPGPLELGLARFELVIRALDLGRDEHFGRARLAPRCLGEQLLRAVPDDLLRVPLAIARGSGRDRAHRRVRGVVGVRVGDAVVVGWSGATEAGGWIAGVTTPSCGAGAVVDVGSALGDSSPAATVVAVGPAST